MRRVFHRSRSTRACRVGVQSQQDDGPVGGRPYGPIHIGRRDDPGLRLPKFGHVAGHRRGVCRIFLSGLRERGPSKRRRTRRCKAGSFRSWLSSLMIGQVFGRRGHSPRMPGMPGVLVQEERLRISLFSDGRIGRPVIVSRVFLLQGCALTVAGFVPCFAVRTVPEAGLQPIRYGAVRENRVCCFSSAAFSRSRATNRAYDDPFAPSGCRTMYRDRLEFPR